MKNKGCLGCLVTFLAVIAILIVAIRHVQSSLHPVYHGKRLVEWADEAVYAEDHAARQKAVNILREACSREGEDARLLVYKEFVVVKNGREPIDQLPEELLPFLLKGSKKNTNAQG